MADNPRNPGMNVPLRPIEPLPGSYDCGITENQEQVIMGVYCPTLVCVFFNSSGDLLRLDHNLLTLPRLACDPHIYDISSEKSRKHIQERQDNLQRALGFRRKRIIVKEFLLPDHAIGIRQRPSYLNAEQYSRPEMLLERKNWDESGRFVFVWAEEYWLESDGTCEI